MSWLQQAAEWLRELLVRQAWIEPARPLLDRTPDWVLLAAGPALLVLVLLAFRPRRQSGARKELLDAKARRAAKAQNARPNAQPAKTGANPEAHATAPQDGRARVFMSYSRKDAAFTLRLAGALEARGHVVDFDRAERDPDNVDAGISADEEWWKRLQNMIAGADVMVLVVTPDSAASRVCDDEIDYARAMGKRIIPILRRPIDFAAAPPRLAALNVKLSFEQDAAFPQSLTALGAALDVDVAWRREGARLMALAAKWDQDGCSDEQLLRAGAVEQAQTWMARRPGAEPEAGPLLVAFLDASRGRETRDTDARRRLIQRGFVQPTAAALAEGRHDAALRLMAGGALLSEDPDFLLDADDEPMHRYKLWRAGSRGMQHNLTGVLHGHEGGVRCVAFSPDGARIATASSDKTARIWDGASGEEVAALLGHNDTVSAAAFSPDGARILTASGDHSARLWSAATGAPIAVLDGHAAWIDAIAFSPDSARVVTGARDQTARLWDAATGAQIAVLKHIDRATSVAFSPDGGRVLTSDRHGARLWDAATGAEIASLRGHADTVVAVVFSSDGSHIATASYDNTARLWRASDGSEIAVLRGHSDNVARVAFSHDGTLILTGSWDNTARLWDGSTGAERAVLSGHTGRIESLAFSPDNTRVATASHDKTVRVWDVDAGEQIATLQGHEGPVTSIAFSPDGVHVLSGSDDGTARIWHAASEGAMAVMRGGPGVARASFSPDGTRVVTCGDPVARIWDGATGRERGALHGRHQVTRAAFSPDSARIATSSERDQSVLVWDGVSGTEVAILPDLGWAAHFAYSPDGKRILAGGDVARICDAATGAPLTQLNGHAGRITTVAFSPDGKHALTGGEDGTARLWDPISGEQRAVMGGHKGSVLAAKFSPDSSRIVTGAGDNTARLWDAATGAELALLRGRDAAGYAVIACVAFSPDGKRALTGSEDSIARLWDVATGAEILRLGGHSGGIKDVAFSSDGVLILTAGGATARLWDAEAGAELAVLNTPQENIWTAAFSPDGARVLTGSAEGTARLWDISWSKSFNGDRAVFLAAALDRGVGRRSLSERSNVLMRDAPNDLFAALMARLPPERRGRVQEASRILRAARDPRRYASLSG
jgi:WD40 repeat protein